MGACFDRTSDGGSQALLRITGLKERAEINDQKARVVAVRNPSTRSASARRRNTLTAGVRPVEQTMQR